MKILMFGWEYPPIKSGGLGTACYGLTKAMAAQGAEVTLVVPRAKKSEFSKHLNLIDSKSITVNESLIKYIEIDSLLAPYMTEELYNELIHNYQNIFHGEYNEENPENSIYGKDIYKEIARFAYRAGLIAKMGHYDIVVCHDWMTVDAGIIAKNILGVPLCLHIHATEMHRTGGNPNQFIYEIEKRGMEQADLIISNSLFTKHNCVEKFGIAADKIIPIHLGMDTDLYTTDKLSFGTQEKVVLFLARLTMQKGPEYFIQAAHKALQFDPDLRFIVAGNGEFLPRLLDLTAQLGIADKVLFAGFLNEDDAKRAYQLADLFVMTSIAEPFGLTVFEAVRSGVPCIIPHTSGVAEVMNHCIKIDFWDIDELANSIVSICKHPELQKELVENSYRETAHFTWEECSRKTLDVYRSVIAQKQAARKELTYA